MRENGAVNPATITDYRLNKLRSLLEEYAPQGIFTCDETGVFYKVLLDRTLSFPGDTCSGGKHSKERITVMVGANTVGDEKLPLLIIGRSENPRCFKGTKKISAGTKQLPLFVIGKSEDPICFKDVYKLPVWYSCIKKAWITQALLEFYLCCLDRKFELQR